MAWSSAAFISRFGPGGLARASVELLLWLLLRAVVQAAAILLLARALGAESYGTFVAILAIAGIFASVTGLGLPSVLLRDGSRSPSDLPRLLGLALRVSTRASFGFTIVAVLTVALTLPNAGLPIGLIAALILAEISSTTIIDLVGRAFQAKHQMRAYGTLQVGLQVARLVAVCVIYATSDRALDTWIWVYTSSNFFYVAATILFARSSIGWKLSQEELWPLVREGIPFTVGATSARVQAEYNKPLLAQAAFTHAAQFNIAQRMIDLVNLPIQAMQEALWPRLYASRDHGRRLLISGAALVLMSLVGIGFVVATARIIPRLLGAEYASSAELIIWLAGLPLLSVLKNLGNFHLIATGRTHLLTWIYIAGTIASIGFATYWIPEHGLLGAAWSCYASELVALLCMAVLTMRIR